MIFNKYKIIIFFLSFDPHRLTTPRFNPQNSYGSDTFQEPYLDQLLNEYSNFLSLMQTNIYWAGYYTSYYNIQLKNYFNQFYLRRNLQTAGESESLFRDISPTDINSRATDAESRSSADSGETNIYFPPGDIVLEKCEDENIAQEGDRNMIKDDIAIETRDNEMNVEGIDDLENELIKNPFASIEPTIFTGKPEDIYLHPYACREKIEIENRKVYRKYKKYQYLKNIEKDNSISFLLGIKTIVSTYVFRNIFKEKDNIRKKISYIEFFDTCGSYNNNEFDTINSEIEYEKLYDQFEKYKSWAQENYRLNMKGNKNIKFRNIFRHFLNIFDKKKENSRLELIDSYINILTSSNYKILFRILPGFNLLNKFRKIDGSFEGTLKAIRYLQLILCTFESFRYNYFENKKILSVNLQNLYLNENFNETILIISIILNKFLALIKFKKQTFVVLEVYSFIYFVKAKYNHLYIESEMYKSFVDINYFDNKIFKQDISDELNGIYFERKIKNMCFIRNIYKIIRKNGAIKKLLEDKIFIKKNKRISRLK